MSRVYTIWPATKDGHPATCSSAWRQDGCWLVLDVTDHDDHVVVEGPVCRQTALRRELELRAVAREHSAPARSTSR